LRDCNACNTNEGYLRSSPVRWLLVNDVRIKYHKNLYSLLINVKVSPHNLIGSNTGKKYTTKMGPDAMIYILSQSLSDYRQDTDWLSDLLNITTSNYDSLSELHIPKIAVTTAHIQ
jgi:hypothetical protein